MRVASWGKKNTSLNFVNPISVILVVRCVREKKGERLTTIIRNKHIITYTSEAMHYEFGIKKKALKLVLK